jgi:hypothetical protein
MYVEGGQIIDFPKEKSKIMIYKTLHRKLNIEQHEPHNKTGSELRCSGRINSSSSTLYY